ncbi:M23 family metallopeptidase [Candidatus Leptofilum sp.]|uniref:M23 family metallopeptidase n=1 Tax=Candidatus Leptofilum sp. TaxID=3241576 RepID=UPI003B5BB7B7
MPVTQPSPIQHTIHLLPQATSLAELDKAVTLLHPNRSAFTYSADAAQAVAHAGNNNSVVVAWAGERWGADGAIFNWLHRRGIGTQARKFDGSSVAGHVSQPGARTLPLRIQHTIHLLPQDTTLPELKQVTKTLHPTRSAFTYSADVVHALMFAGDDSSKVVVWSGKRWSGDIFAWLRQRGIKFESQRFSGPETVSGGSFIFTHWPTEHTSITQKFLKNPQNYAPPLVGHEGIDIVAPFESKVFAVANGTVYKVRDANKDSEHPYGTAVYLRHSDGYRTAYAHLKEAKVKVGDFVQGGQLIGIADSTGNVIPKPTPTQPHLGSHLHLSLYLDGATQRKETPQPFDLIDPEPYLIHLQAGWPAPTGELVSGWAFASSIEKKGMVARVHSTFINLRAEPGSFKAKLGRVNHGTVMRLLGGRNQDYYPVAVPKDAIRRVDTAVTFGMHNLDGADWMKRNGMQGWALHAIGLGTNAAPQDMTQYERAGIKMLIRLNYGFHPQGNQPASNSPDHQRYLDACVETMRRSKGVWGFIFGNETNNPQEFPGGVHGEKIKPEQYALAYNDVWRRKPAGVRLGVQAIDPYFGPGSDSRDYWQRVLNNLTGTDFITVHPKTQDSNPNNVDSDAKFTNDPLRWQFLHLKSYQPLLAVVPERFWTLPVIATEVNPQRHNDNRTLGWQENQGAKWVRRAAAHFIAYNENALIPINGVIFYRFTADDWELHNKPSILNAIKKL